MPAHFRRPALMLCATTALGLTVAGCKIDNRPLLARDGAPAAYAPANAAYAYAPDASALPYAEPARVVPAANSYDGYALAERAYAYDRAAYRQPPSYGFDYGDVEPWAWQTAGDDLMFAEPIDDGYRFYYYEPGEAYPYFVRDPQYGYAYGGNGVLTALFSAAGALLPTNQLYGVAPVAGRYLARGYDLRQTYYNAPRLPVAEPIWTERAPILYRAQQSWIDAAERQPAWRDYRVSTGERLVRDFQARPFRRVAAPIVRDIPEDRDTRDFRDFRGPRERERAASAYEHQANASARIEQKAARDFAKEQRRDARDFAKAQQREFKAERHEAKDWAKAERHEAKDWAKAERQQVQAVARNERAQGPQRHEDHGAGGGKADGHPNGGGHEDHGKGGGDKGHGDDHGKGKH